MTLGPAERDEDLTSKERGPLEPATSGEPIETRVIIVPDDQLPNYPEEDWTDDEVHDYFERVFADRGDEDAATDSS